MPLYHLHAQVISRSSGRSVIAAAAYRAGVEMDDRTRGITHDYSNKRGVVYSEIDMPRNAPERFLDRETLWNEVESVERASNARLAREIEFSLPREFNHREMVEFSREFVCDNFVERGMIADWSIHDVDGSNPHVHVLLTLRSVDEEGFMPKAQKQYLCRDVATKEEYWLSPRSLKAIQEQSHVEKLYWYRKEQLTSTEAQEQGFTNGDRSTRYPISRKQETNDWSEHERILEWREAYEQYQNKALERHYERFSAPERDREYVDCRSYRDRGLEEAPQVHVGPYINQMEREFRYPISERTFENMHNARLNGEYDERSREYREAVSSLEANVREFKYEVERRETPIELEQKGATIGNEIARSAQRLYERARAGAEPISDREQRERARAQSLERKLEPERSAAQERIRALERGRADASQSFETTKKALREAEQQIGRAEQRLSDLRERREQLRERVSESFSRLKSIMDPRELMQHVRDLGLHIRACGEKLANEIGLKPERQPEHAQSLNERMSYSYDAYRTMSREHEFSRGMDMGR